MPEANSRLPIRFESCPVSHSCIADPASVLVDLAATSPAEFAGNILVIVFPTAIETSASFGVYSSAWCSWFITFDCNSFIVIERSLVRFWERRKPFFFAAWTGSVAVYECAAVSRRSLGFCKPRSCLVCWDVQLWLLRPHRGARRCSLNSFLCERNRYLYSNAV
jgi:hypothetical protein